MLFDRQLSTMKLSSLKLLCVCIAALIVLAPDAQAQKRKRGGGGRGGAGAGAGKRGGRGAKKNTSMPTGMLSKGDATPSTTGFGELSPQAQASEKRFRELMAQIDAALAAVDERASAHESAPASPIALPRDLGPGSAAWKDLQRPIFSECDRDGSGWISFREANLALGFERGEYALFDRDRDGRIGSREFIARYDEVVASTGVFPLPKPSDDSGAIVPRTPKQLSAAFDQDTDGALDLGEVGQMLRDYDREEIEPKMALERLDENASGKIDGEEIGYLSRLVSAAFVLPDPAASRKGQRAAEETFFEMTERSGGLDATSLPPRVAGPVMHFRRLDLDGDGFVTTTELHELQAPLTLSVRVTAVLAALDADEDNRISRKEFASALKPAR